MKKKDILLSNSLFFNPNASSAVLPKYTRMLFSETLSGVQNVLRTCGLNFVPEMQNGKIIVYFIYENYLTKENCKIFDNITNEEIGQILSSINVSNLIEYSYFLYFVFNRILKLQYVHSGFAIPGVYDGQKCYLTFYKNNNMIKVVIHLLDSKNYFHLQYNKN